MQVLLLSQFADEETEAWKMDSIMIKVAQLGSFETIVRGINNNNF